MKLLVIILMLALVVALVLLHYVNEQAEMFKEKYFHQLQRNQSLECDINSKTRELECLRKELFIINP